jgi:ribosome-associated translation inhibitor RaiA
MDKYIFNRIETRCNEIRSMAVEFEKNMILVISKTFADNYRQIKQTLADITDCIKQSIHRSNERHIKLQKTFDAMQKNLEDILVKVKKLVESRKKSQTTEFTS